MEAVGETDRPAPEPLGDPPPVEDSDPLSSAGGARARCARRCPRTGIVVLESPTSTLALRNRMRISRPGSYFFCAGGGLGYGLSAGVGRAAGPARPPGGVRARRGLGAVRDQRLLDGGGLQGAGHVPDPAQRRVRDPEVVRAGRAGHGRAGPGPARARDGEDRRGLRREVVARVRVAGRPARARSTRRSARASRGWSRWRSSRACRCSDGACRGRAPAPDRLPDELADGHARAAALAARGRAGRGAGAHARARPGPLRVRRQPLPADPAGGGDGAGTPGTWRRRSRSGAAWACRSRCAPAAPASTARRQGAGILVDVRRNFAGIRVEDGGERVRVGPGTVLGRVNRALVRHDRRVGPDPASTDLATVGGVIANNAGGMRCGVRHDSYSTLRSLEFVHGRPARASTPPRPTPRSASPREEPELARGPGARSATRSAPTRSSTARIRREVRDQEHHRLPPVRVPRRRRAGGDLPPPAGGLGGHARLHRRGRVRHRAPRPPRAHRRCCSSRASTPPRRPCPRWSRRAPPRSS